MCSCRLDGIQQDSHPGTLQLALPITLLTCVFLLLQVLMATNRIDILDAALLRPGRIDRKIEFPNPNEGSRFDILKIHSRKMNLMRGIDLKKVADKMPVGLLLRLWAMLCICLHKVLLQFCNIVPFSYGFQYHAFSHQKAQLTGPIKHFPT